MGLTKKKVIKGWMGKNRRMGGLFGWKDVNGHMVLDTGSFGICKIRGKKREWSDAWPPKRVTITIEVEDK